MKKTKNLYIAFEGIDGVGKTYHAKQLVEKLRNAGVSVVQVKEPHTEPIKEFVKTFEFELEKVPGAKTYAIAADRLILQKNIILPSLKDGKTVVSDRSIYTHIVYEGVRGLNNVLILEVNKPVRFPDKVFLLDVSPNVVVERIKNRGVLRSFENKTFATKARDIYLKLSQQEKERFIIIDSNRKKEIVEEEIWQKVKEIMEIS
jgi:dTMP kinase